MSVLRGRGARVLVERDGDGAELRIETEEEPGRLIGSCRTSYPDGLIQAILELRGPGWLRDEILRDESPQYVRKALEPGLFGFVEPSSFAGKRLLDFGCGAGASSCVLARMLPDTEIVGIELLAEHLEVAAMRLEHHGIADRVSLQQSPAPDRLPDELGEFDFISFSAVFEHLLPAERAPILQQVWERLRPGGVIFLNQTPNSVAIGEYHTTGGLPLLNYLPDGLAFRIATRFSGRCRGQSWEQLLRAGIRGATPGEILGILEDAPGSASPQLLPIRRERARNDIELWYQSTSMLSRRNARLKAAIRASAYALWPLRTFVVPTLVLGIRKQAD